MRYVKNTIEIWKMESGESFVSRVSLGPCPHCLGYECIVDTVRLSGTAPEKWPHAVHCGELVGAVRGDSDTTAGFARAHVVLSLIHI